jgi:hypothetical protein
MHWTYKAFADLGLSWMPFGEHSYFLGQRYVTRSVPTREEKLVEIVSNAKAHLDGLTRHDSRPLSGRSFYEFGAGRDLLIPLVFWCFGVELQILVDIR